MTTFPQARPAKPSVMAALSEIQPALEIEIQRRKTMPPAFFRHHPPAPVRPDLLSGSPRLISALKDH